ncbi:hypothetical protein [Blastomonas fulva]|uniref:hypothetical protein n=1 Tax=Blastomonas fulva TaxID=1550728 RepID=UPI0025A3676D|nr:hypothetical protein [Blastomonas fulva]MDM7928941.1 hypothetical protein [Blastomonas fulva]MDM7964727.1 hypothetical protein [Blastomonas fulva]
MIRINRFGLLALLLLVAACAPKPAPQTAAPADPLDAIARQYVMLSLEIGTHEDGYIDAYYGPAEWKTAAEAAPRALPALAQAVDGLDAMLATVDVSGREPLVQRRATFLRAQLNAARTRLRMLRGEKLSFREESLGLFGATPDIRPLESYDPVLAEIETLLPGPGTLAERVDAFQERFVIPADRLKPVFDRAIAECRARTAAHIPLPKGESFRMEFVTGKPWSGYNYYQGNLASLIQINTDLPIRISRAVDLGCHEGYPGHHALNYLLEQRLMRARGWMEYSVYPLYSPQSLIAEGSANYGIDLAFPGDEKLAFEMRELYPLAGIATADAARLTRLQKALAGLRGARFTIAQMYLDGQIDRPQAIALTQKYQLMSEARAKQSIGFTDTYRSYVINYGLGQDMVQDFVEAAGSDAKARWAAMERVISEPTLPADLAVR